MKAVALALVMLVASASCWPQGSYTEVDTQSQRIVDVILEAFINELAELIQDRGLDPYYLESGSAGWEFAVPNVFKVEGSAQSVSLVGLSDNTINAISYNMATGLLHLDLQLNHLAGSVAAANGEINALGHTLEASGSGSLEFTKARINCRASVQIGITGININNILIIASIEDVKSDISLNVFGLDLSDQVNALFNDHLLDFMDTHEHRISNLLEYIVLRIVDLLLP